MVFGGARVGGSCSRESYPGVECAYNIRYRSTRPLAHASRCMSCVPSPSLCVCDFLFIPIPSFLCWVSCPLRGVVWTPILRSRRYRRRVYGSSHGCSAPCLCPAAGQHRALCGGASQRQVLTEVVSLPFVHHRPGHDPAADCVVLASGAGLLPPCPEEVFSLLVPSLLPCMPAFLARFIAPPSELHCVSAGLSRFPRYIVLRRMTFHETRPLSARPVYTCPYDAISLALVPSSLSRGLSASGCCLRRVWRSSVPLV